MTCLPPGEPAGDGEADGDGGVDVRAGDVANGVDHGHDGHPPHQGDAWERGHAVVVVHRHNPAAGEDQEERCQEFRNELANGEIKCVQRNNLVRECMHATRHTASQQLGIYDRYIYNNDDYIITC